MTIYANISVDKNLKGAVIMKKKIISMLMITSLSIALFGCGAEATYVNPVTGEAMDKEEVEELQEMRDELSELEGYDEFEAEVLGNNNYDEADEEKEEESLEEEDTEEITIANYLGKELEKGSGMGYKYVLYEKGATVYHLETEAIPSEIKTEKGDIVPVIGIENNLYEGNAKNSIQSLTIPSNIVFIGGFFVSGCSNLEEVIIPNTVEVFDGNQSFEGCSNLKKVTFPEEFVICGEWKYTFNSCSSLEKVSLPRGVKIISDNFNDCNNLTECILNDDLETIKTSFIRCENLSDIKIPASVTTIWGGFSSIGVENIIIPDTVKELIRFSSIDHCPNLKTIEIGDVEYAEIFGPNDFSSQGCESLSKIVFPKNVGDVSDSKELRFRKSRLPSLTELYLPDGLEELYLEGFENGELTVYIEESVIDFLSQKYPGVNFVAR